MEVAYMKLVDGYVNDLMTNHKLESEYELTECSPVKAVLTGGGPPKDRPTGGFPPIHLCDKEEKLIKVAPPREYKAPTGTVSISSILEQRRKKKKKKTKT